MTPDKATVELVAKAIEHLILGHMGMGPDDVEEIALTALAALPTPTDASGLVEALELIASCATSDPNFWMVAVAEKALAQHREGNPWSDEVPTEPGWWWNLRDGANLDMCFVDGEDFYYYDEVAMSAELGSPYYVGTREEAKGQWRKATPPEGS